MTLQEGLYNMKCAIFYGNRDIRVEEHDIPQLGPRDVLIQVKACGVCGSDVHIFEGGQGASNIVPPVILGHEFSGVIVEVGRDVFDFKIGDRVSVDPNCNCGVCDACREGITHFCENMVGYGTTVNGGYAEFCAVNVQSVYHLGENTSFIQGAMAEPVGCCLHGIDMCQIQPGHHVAVIGGGMIGMLMIQLAKLAGASKVALLEPILARREIGKKLGADICIDPLQEDTQAALYSAGMKHLHTVIECVGRASTMEQAIALAGRKGVVMMFGLTRPEEVIALRPFDVFRKELVLKASYINPCTQRRALELIDSGRLDVSSAIFDICGLEKLKDIMEDPQLRSKGKFIISPEIRN